MKRLQQHAACSLIHPTSHTFHHTASSSDCTTARPLLLLYVLRTLSPTHTTFHCIADVIKNKEMRITTQSTILHYSLYWRCDAASFCLPTRSAVLRASTHSSQLSLSLDTTLVTTPFPPRTRFFHHPTRTVALPLLPFFFPTVHLPPVPRARMLFFLPFRRSQCESHSSLLFCFVSRSLPNEM